MTDTWKDKLSSRILTQKINIIGRWDLKNSIDVVRAPRNAIFPIVSTYFFEVSFSAMTAIETKY